MLVSSYVYISSFYFENAVITSLVVADSRDCFGRMAASVSDSTQRPLQNAMKLVKVAIQLDTGNRHKVHMFKSLNLPCLFQIWTYLSNKCMREWRNLAA